MPNFEANLDPAKDYRMTFSGIGDHLVGQIFDLADLNTPVASLSGFDSTYSSGHSGILVAAPDASPTSAGDATFDNYLATVPGDFNADSVLSAEDIDLLSAEIFSPEPRLRFDLNDDGIVDQDDRSVWVSDLKQTFFGDADLDGQVNAADLNNLALSWQASDATSWAQGDFDGDGNVNATDLNSLALNWRKGTAEAAAVPEPSATTLLLIVGILTITRRRYLRKN
jgi:hypothetical protein